MKLSRIEWAVLALGTVAAVGVGLVYGVAKATGDTPQGVARDAARIAANVAPSTPASLGQGRIAALLGRDTPEAAEACAASGGVWRLNSRQADAGSSCQWPEPTYDPAERTACEARGGLFYFDPRATGADRCSQPMVAASPPDGRNGGIRPL